MSDELKEILDKLRYYAKRYEDIVNGEEYLDRNGYISKTIDDIDKNILNEYKNKKLLLDYITNLQEGHCNYKEKCNEYNVGCIKEILCDYKKQIIDLQEENERLSRTIVMYDELLIKKNNTIDKAVKYINKYEYQRYCPGPYEKDKYIMREEKEGQDLLNIFRGENNVR